VEYPKYGVATLSLIGGRKVTALAEARRYTLVFWSSGCGDGMILRVSGKLGKKIHVAPAETLEQDPNPFADWSAHLFTAERLQYVLVTNTAALYSALMVGKGITSGEVLIERTINLLRYTLMYDGLGVQFDRRVAPATGEVSFSKALNRGVIGSMNDLIYHAKFYIIERGMSLPNTSLLLNGIPMGKLKYAKAREALLKLE